MPRNRLPRLINNYTTKGKWTKEDLGRDLWMCETGTGQQVAQLLDCYMMKLMTILLNKLHGVHSC
jgi:hypothetical protein